MTTVTNEKIHGPWDLYTEMVKVSKADRKPGGVIPNVCITKKQCKRLGIDWAFVEQSAQLLGLEIAKCGQYGFIIEKPLHSH